MSPLSKPKLKLQVENQVVVIVLKMRVESSFPPSRQSRRKVARETAVLLYTLQEKEYKQAKEKAANNLGTRILPTNREVAEELDMIAEEREGPVRSERLARMRREALDIMKALKPFHPRLVGSVWRGTPHHSSDIDITVFSSNQDQVIGKLKYAGFRIVKTEMVSAKKRGQKGISFHITVNLPSGDEAEIVVRNPEEIMQKVRCEIYGDIVRGIDIDYLRKVLRENPLQKFVPEGNS